MTPSSALPPEFRCIPLAHRGLHDKSRARPENSCAAIDAAMAAGYGCECDVQMSADGVAMVFHDATLERMTAARGPVAARTAAELGKLALAGTGDTIPTLAEILQLVHGRGPLLIEIKDQTGAFAPGPDGLEHAVARDLAGYDGSVAVMSFNPHVVAAFGAADPSCPRGLTTASWAEPDAAHLPDATRHSLRNLEGLGPSGASFISHEAGDLTRPHIAALRATGMPVLCWTIRSPEEETAARPHCDGITFERYRPVLQPA